MTKHIINGANAGGDFSGTFPNPSLNATPNVKAIIAANAGSGAVSSVAGKTGAVTLVEGDVQNLTADLAAKANSSSLSTVATSGSYTDLTNKPTIPTVTGTNTGDQTLSYSAGSLSISGANGNTVTIPTGGGTSPVTSVAGRTGDVTLTKSDVGLLNVDNTSDVNKPISSATQTALNAKADNSSLATVATSGSYNDLINKPTIPSVSDATTSAKGIIQLSGDLTGTADAPSVSVLHSGNNGQILRYNNGSAMWDYFSNIASDATTTAKGVIMLAGDLTGTAATPNVNFNNDTLHVAKSGDTMTGNLNFDTSTSAKNIQGTRATTGTGQVLLVQGGGAQSGGTDLNGGELRLSGGTGVGNNGSNLTFYTATDSLGTGTTDRTPNEKMRITSSSAGRLLIGTTTVLSANDTAGGDGLTLGGDVQRSVRMNRRTGSVSPGNNLLISSGGAAVGSTDASAGILYLQTGPSTGAGTGVIIFRLPVASASGTTDNAQTEQARLTTAGLGLAGVTPTHTLTLGSLATGAAFYNTADQTTNYERVIVGWNSNVFSILNQAGGTGNTRGIQVKSTGGTTSLESNSGTGIFAQDGNTTTGKVRILAAGSSGAMFGTVVGATFNNGVSLIQTALSVQPTINQSGSAGYTGLQINATEVATGSGIKLLQDWQVGGVSKSSIDNNGKHIVQALQIGSTATAGYVLTGDASGNATFQQTNVSSPTGVLPVANGGTGSATQNFVDLTTAQTVAGNKTLSGTTYFSGGLKYSTTVRTTGSTLGSTSPTIELCNATSAAFTITLPTAAGNSGIDFIIKKTDSSANAVTVATTSSQTIDNATTYSLPSQNKYINVVSDGTNWQIIANN